MTRVIRTALLLCITLLFVTQALAADGGRYAVAPFAVNGPASFGYLEKAVPSMLSSRLYRKGQFEPVPDTAVIGLGKVSNSSSARQAIKKTGAGYVVWGDVTVIGQDALINAHVTDAAGKEWNRQSKTQVNNMIASLQGVADGLTAELFGAAAVQPAATAGAPLNPNMVQNQPTSGQVYLNPQIRYQGMDGARLRTQHLPFLARGMAVGDFNGDGKNEIALLDKNRLYMYRWTDRMEKIAEYDFSKMQLALTVKTIDLNRDGVPELIVSAVGLETSSSVTIRDSGGASLFTRAEDGYSYILSFKGNRFTELAARLPFYLSVVRMPPDYRPVLVGQKGDSHTIFSRNGAYEVEKENGRYVLSRRLNLPKGVNIFSFAWLPGDGGKNPPVMVSITGKEKLCVRSEDGKELYTSQDMYSGSSAGIEESTSLPGFGKSNEVIPDVYYVPMRMIAADFDKNRQWEILVNKPISAAAQFFSSYRDFPECEIHALTWDGVGTNLLWKTRRIKGTVTDFAVSDPNNDGVMDLVVCLNTHTGVLGTTASKTVLVAYPLDFSKTDPNTPAVISE